MRKVIFFNIAILFALLANPAYAASTPTPAPSGAPTKADSAVQKKLDDQINQLKEKIASRVSELNLVEKRGIIGTVTEVKGNQITITDAEGNIRFIDVDEITKFASASKKGTFGLADVTKGTKISVLGIYNKQSKRLLARFVNAYTEPVHYSGAISAIDVKNFQLTMVTADQKTVKVDVDTSSKVSSYTGEDSLTKYGFSKLAVGDRIALTANPGKTDPNTLEASRIIDFIGVPKDPRIVISGATEAPASPAATTKTAPVTPTTGTKKTLTPIR